MRRAVAALAALMMVFLFSGCTKEAAALPKVLVIVNSPESENDSRNEDIENAMATIGTKAQILYEHYDLELDLSAQALQYDIIVNLSLAAAQDVISLAKASTDTKFITVVTGDTKAVPENCVGMYFNGTQGGFLAGAAAALTDSTGKLGVVREQYYEDWYEGFLKGAQYIQPQTQIITADIENSSAYEQAKNLFDEGCKVVYCCAKDNMGAADAAKDSGGLLISTGMEMYDYLPDNALTAVFDDSGALAADMLGRVIEDAAQFGIVKEYGLIEGGVLLSDNYQNLTEQIYTEVNRIRTDIITGNIKI